MSGLDLSRLTLHAQDKVLADADSLVQQQVETLKLYEPMPWQERFHACRARECLIRKAQQVGGSLCMFVELARAVTNQDPHGKYPNGGTIVVIGYGEKHIGNNIYKYLFAKGHNDLRIIRDQETKQWRIFRPWEGVKHGKQGDKGREKESKPAPPLIPSRFYNKKAFSWVKQRQRIFSKVELNTGWTILAYNSQGDARHAMGIQATAVFIDEDLADANWYTEMLGRTMIPASRGHGYIRWNAVPQGDNDAMMRLIETCEMKEAGDHSAEMITATLFDNIYLDEKARDENIKKWQREGDDVYDQRVLGKLTLGERLMYPRFHEQIHGIHNWELPGGIEMPNGMHVAGFVPRDWTRYIVIDPGVVPGSVGFFAVPPPGSSYGRIVLMYDELQIKDCTAKKLAESIRPKISGVSIRDIIVDWHGSRSREAGSGVAIYKQYLAEQKKAGIRCEARESGFARGNDDVQGRTQLLRSMLWADPHSEEDELPAFRYVVENCPHLEWEMKKYKKKVVVQGGQKIVLDEPNVRGIHIPVICEYAAAYRMRYVKPLRTNVVKRHPLIQERIESLHARKNRGKSVVCLN